MLVSLIVITNAGRFRTTIPSLKGTIVRIVVPTYSVLLRTTVPGIKIVTPTLVTLYENASFTTTLVLLVYTLGPRWRHSATSLASFYAFLLILRIILRFHLILLPVLYFCLILRHLRHLQIL